MGIISTILGLFGLDSLAGVVDSSKVTETLVDKAKDKATDYAKDKAQSFATDKAKSLLNLDSDKSKNSKKTEVDKSDKYWYLKDK